MPSAFAGEIDTVVVALDPLSVAVVAAVMVGELTYEVRFEKSFTVIHAFDAELSPIVNRPVGIALVGYAPNDVTSA